MNIISFQQSVFIAGFLTGFVSVFLYIYASHNFKPEKLNENFSKTIWNLIENWSEDSNFNTWLQKKNIELTKIDIDTFVYAKELFEDTGNSQVILESEWLKSKVPVTCVVFVEKLKLAVTIKDTWGRHCNQLLFFSQHLSDVDLPVINLGIKYTSSWQLLCEVMNFIWKRSNTITLNWLIFVRDDTFVILENLRYILAPLDFKEPHYLGHSVVLWGLPYNVAQAGYVLSFGILQRLMEVFNTSEKCAAGGKYWKKEDFYLGKHLASLGIHPSDTRDSRKRGTFHGFPLNIMLWGVAKPDNYYTRALYPPGPECCSDKSVTFNVGEANRMRTINYLLYHLHIFQSGIHGNKPAPTPIPENEVWKSALREEFNLTDIDDISSDRYFQMWRRKYSEPEKFIAENFGKIPKS